MKKIFSILFFCVFICFFKAYSLEEMQENILNDIFLHAEQSIERIEKGKIYLRPEKLYFSENQICIEKDEGKGIAIPGIASDGSGIFLSMETITIPTWECVNCGLEYEQENLPPRCDRCNHYIFEFTGYATRLPDGKVIRSGR